MAERSMDAYKGEVSRCKLCTNADNEPMDCQNCLAFGFVAKCMSCDGKGQVEAPVAGSAAGTMKSTCASCGGRGTIPTRKPENWVPPEPEKKELASA